MSRATDTKVFLSSSHLHDPHDLSCPNMVYIMLLLFVFSKCSRALSYSDVLFSLSSNHPHVL